MIGQLHCKRERQENKRKDDAETNVGNTRSRAFIYYSTIFLYVRLHPICIVPLVLIYSLSVLNSHRNYFTKITVKGLFKIISSSINLIVFGGPKIQYINTLLVKIMSLVTQVSSLQ